MDARNSNPAVNGEREAERGSALLIAILVAVILTLLGISFLLMAETENKIAENERLAAQALYVGETATRQVKRWFDHPPNLGGTWNVRNPPLAAIDRTLRMIDQDGDPTTAPVAQDGSSSAPRYKQSSGLVFDRPYRPSLENTLLGTETGPDMRISRATSAGATFLDDLAADLFPGYPGDGLEARIEQIDVYAPPTLDINGNWTRYGMATVRIVSRIVQDVGGTDVVLAERMIKAVLNETPYPGPFGPLHSCANLTWNGDFTVHWGAGSAVGDSQLTNNLHKIKSSLPRVEPAGQRLDMLWGYDAGTGTAAPFNDYLTQLYASTEEIEDPWFRYLSRGDFVGSTWMAGASNPADTIPMPFNWTVGTSTLGDETYPSHDHFGADDGNHSNVMQKMAVVSCPQFDYDTWKTIAQSGTSDVHYYAWDNGTTFRENGTGPAQTFRTITDQVEGLYFFDTRDGVRPVDSDGDGYYENLTPPIALSGGTWGTRGFVYLNAETFQTKGVTGRAVQMAAPGEPFLDIDSDGQYDAGTEPYVNLDYPTSLSDPFEASATDTLQDDGTYVGAVTRNSRGPTFNETAVLWGILYNSGQFEATGNARYYGSVIGESGIGENSPAAGTPEFYWDQSIVDNWPPPGWDLPRVIITRWETDL